MDKVHSTWQAIQKGLQAHHPAEFAENPFVRFALMTPNYPDFIRYAQAADAALAEDLIEAYARESSEAIDDLAPGTIDPRSRTAVHLYFMVRILQWLGRRDLTILDIGCGYGNMARMFTQLKLCATYDMVDIGGVIDVARTYLAQWRPHQDGYPEVRVFNIEDEGDQRRVAQARHDLMISTFAMTEAPLEMQRWYLEALAPNHRWVYLAGQKSWNGMDCISQIRECLDTRFLVSESEFPFRSPFDPPVFEIQAAREDRAS